MNNDTIMNNIAKHHENFNGWVFSREYQFDQYRNKDVSLCFGLGWDGPENELSIQVSNDDGDEICSETFILDEISTEKVLEKVLIVMNKIK